MRLNFSATNFEGDQNFSTPYNIILHSLSYMYVLCECYQRNCGGYDLMQKEDVNYDNVRQVLNHYHTKKPRFMCKIFLKTRLIMEKSNK